VKSDQFESLGTRISLLQRMAVKLKQQVKVMELNLQVQTTRLPVHSKKGKKNKE